MMAHRAYQPLLPTGNKYLQQKWDKASFDLHREKVESAKPTINTTPPKTYSHLAVKLKDQKLEEERTAKIWRENNMLREKISHIMRTTGGVDNRNYYDRKSLGNKERQLELLQVTKENQVILLRLSQCRSHYDLRSLNEDWLKTLKVMDSIAHYPRGRDKKNSPRSTSDCNEEQGKENGTRTEGKGAAIQQDKVTYPEPEINTSIPSDESPGSSDNR